MNRSKPGRCCGTRQWSVRGVCAALARLWKTGRIQSWPVIGAGL